MDYLSLVDTGTLLSGRVFDEMGDDHGSVKELLVDPKSGKIVLLVLASGGVLGMGTTDRILPWQAVQLNPNTNDFMLVIDNSTLEKSPVLSKSDAGDRTALKQLYDYFGFEPYWDDHFPTRSSDPTYQNKEDADPRSQAYIGSHQISHDTLAHNPNNQMSQELNYDKVKGESAGE